MANSISLFTFIVKSENAFKVQGIVPPTLKILNKWLLLYILLVIVNISWRRGTNVKCE